MNFIEYVKQLWKNGPGGGTPWSAARLNHMEDGIKNNNSMISELNNNITFKQIPLTNNGDGTYSCRYTEVTTGLIYLGINQKLSYLYLSNAMWDYTSRKEISKNYIGDISNLSIETTTGRDCEVIITSSKKITNLSVIVIGIN